MCQISRTAALAAAAAIAAAALAWWLWWSRRCAAPQGAERAAGEGAGRAAGEGSGRGAGRASEGFASSPLVSPPMLVKPLAARKDGGEDTRYSRSAEKRILRNIVRAREEAKERGAAV